MAIAISLWIFFLEMHIDIGETVAGWLIWYALPILCQLCLFVPKTLPIVVKKFKSKVKLKCDYLFTDIYLHVITVGDHIGMQ